MAKVVGRLLQVRVPLERVWDRTVGAAGAAEERLPLHFEEDDWVILNGLKIILEIFDKVHSIP
jgi:hypothetical protein